MTDVLLVAEDILTRAGLSALLEVDTEISVVGSCNEHGAASLVRERKPDVVLVSLQYPFTGNLAVLRNLRELPSAPPVITLADGYSDDWLDSALLEGAQGFIEKDTSPDQLRHAVRAVAAGGGALSSRAAREVIERYVDASASRADAELSRIDASLTAREREVLALLGGGLSNREIAQRLSLSVATVKDHVSGLLTKLGSGNRVRAAVIAYRIGLVPSLVSAG